MDMPSSRRGEKHADRAAEVRHRVDAVIKGMDMKRSHQRRAVYALRCLERNAREAEEAETVGLALLGAQWSGYWAAKVNELVTKVDRLELEQGDRPVAVRSRFRRRVEDRMTAAWRRVNDLSDEYATHDLPSGCPMPTLTDGRDVPCQQPQPA